EQTRHPAGYGASHETHTDYINCLESRYRLGLLSTGSSCGCDATLSIRRFSHLVHSSLPSRPCRGSGISLLGFEHMLLSCQSPSCYSKGIRDKVWQRWVRGGLLALSVVLAWFLVFLLLTNLIQLSTP